jgi:arylsulfatase A-like enzyme
MKHYLTSCIMISFFILLFLGGCIFNNSNQGSETVEKRPNVILILTDDQGWGDLGIHGNEKISTPTIDAMAGKGAHFERFFVSPLCAPTRASLLTGRYNLRTGTSWVSKGLENMRPEEVTIAEIFQNQGYATGCFGKWHNGAHFPQHPNQQGFDEFIGFCAGHWNNYFSTTLEHNGQPYETDGYISDVLTDEAISFIEKNKDGEFFCYLPFNAPHGPFQVPDPYFDKYKALGFNDKDAAVYGMCENIDDNVARISKRVDELGLLENTIIIFMTDNGPNGQRYNGGMRGVKGSIHEGGVRVPCVINWEGKISNKSIPQIAGHIDILPTLVSLCNLEPPETLPLDGLDISALLLENNGKIQDRLFFTKKSTESIIPDGAARSDQYRMVIENGDTMLFNMQLDPGQKDDISSREKDVTASLAMAYNNWFTEVTNEFEPTTEIRIGFEEEQTAYLPAHEAGFSGDIHFMEGHGWAHDWLVNWQHTTIRFIGMW